VSNPARVAERNRLFLLGVVPAIAMLVAAAMLWQLVRGNEAGRTAYAEEEYADARSGFLGLRDLGLVERWVAPFNAGTAAFREQEYADAVELFEEALEVVPSERACEVRVNLALTHEAAGNAARKDKSRATALTSFRDARTALGAGGCSDAAERRINGRIRAINSKGPAQPDEENARLSEKEKLEKLERLNDEARQRQKDDPIDPTEEPDTAIQW